MKTETQTQTESKPLKPLKIGPAVFGMWSGGHYMHFGEDVGAERLKDLVRTAYEKGIRTFMTADVYGNGDSDKVLGEALQEYPRESYKLLGAIGHDFYNGIRQGEKGYPRFTDPALRNENEFAAYIKEAAAKSLERLQTNYFDVLFLHNPDQTGYTSPVVWSTFHELKQNGVTRATGLAPGPANGFTLDIIGCFEDFGDQIDWAMIILNPFEPWPGQLCLKAAEKYNVKVLTRVVDYGGIFHDALKPGAQLPRADHRSFRPAGWIEAGNEKLEQLRPYAEKAGASMLQLASLWNMSQSPVAAVVPTLIQERGESGKPLETQIEELKGVEALPKLSAEEVKEIAELGNNKGCMALKGGSRQYQSLPQGDQWPINEKLEEVAKRWGIEPDRDLYFAGDPRDLREKGLPVRGIPQASNKRLFIQFLAFGNCNDTKPIIKLLKEKKLESVVYTDANDSKGIGLLFMSEDPEFFVREKACLLAHKAFDKLVLKPEFAMFGRTYSSGREPDLEDWLVKKPRKTAFNPNWPWAIWYPLRRKGAFETLTPQEQGKILFEHAMIGRNYGGADYAHDIRLACHGLDKNDNEFVIGLTGRELFPLSHIIQTMRKTKQTSEYIESLGPFFVGKAIYQSELKI